MKKRSFAVICLVLFVGSLVGGCQQPTGACVIELGCMDGETKAKCDTYMGEDSDFYEGLSCVDLGFDSPQSQTRGILRP